MLTAFKRCATGIVNAVHSAASRTSYAALFWARLSVNLLLLTVLFIVLAVSGWSGRRGDVSVLLDVTAPGFTVFLMPGDRLPVWQKLHAEFRDAISTDPAKVPCKSGLVTFNESVPSTGQNLELRITKEDAKRVTVILPDLSVKNRSVVLACDGKGVIPEIANVTISFPSQTDRPWSTTLQGRYVFGNAIAQFASTNAGFSPNTLYLSSGSIVTEVKSLPFPSGSIKTKTELYPGDVVSLSSTGNSALSYGALKAVPEGIRLVARSKADVASLTTAGSSMPEEMVLAPPWWARFQAQSEWVIILAIYLLLNGLIAAYDTYCRAVWLEHND